MAKKTTAAPAAETGKAALATGALSALSLLSFGAEAGIIYHNTPISSPTTPNTSVTWDVDGAHGNDFTFFKSNHSGRFYAELNSNGLNGRGLVQQNGDWTSQFRNLPAHFAVGPTLQAGYRVGGTGQAVRVVAGQGQIASTAVGFTSGTPGYFGFKFTDGTNLLYGWAQITIDGPGNQFTIDRWAYNDTPNGSISVGDTGQTSNVPEPGTLSLTLLGLGAAGVRSWRGRKQRQALAA